MENYYANFYTTQNWRAFKFKVKVFFNQVEFLVSHTNRLNMKLIASYSALRDCDFTN
jgi:hypothetical protein